MQQPKLTGAVPLKDFRDVDGVKWIQNQLVMGGYLPAGEVDGAVGPKTLAAFAQFKEEAFLGYPQDLGPSTIEKLATIEPKHKLSEQLDKLPSQLNPDAGKKSGKSVQLPVVGLVYENEMIVPGSNITWGEMTKGLTRLPMSTSDFGSEEQIVKNMLAMAKVFGQVRDKFGSPIGINSAYRPPNLKIGSRRSQHKYARALDVRPLNNNYSKLLDVIKSVPEIRGIGLAGASKGFWHMDIRPTARISFRY